MRKKEGDWMCTDGVKWSEAHWKDGHLGNKTGQNCLKTYRDKWEAYQCNSHYPFAICLLPTSTPIRVDSQILFTSKNISTPALTFKYVSQTTCEEEGLEMIGGFRLEWYFKWPAKSRTEVKDATQNLWRKGYAPKSNGSNLNILTLMNLVRESKRNKIDEGKVLHTLLKHRWSEDIVKSSPCLDREETYDVIKKVAAELGLVHSFNNWVLEEDLTFGLELYSIIQKCPAHLVEATKMSIFVEHLVTNFKLNTVVAASLHSIQPNADKGTNDFTAVNMWYERLDKRYNFSLAPLLLPLLPSDNLTRLTTLDPPYLKDYKAHINEQGHGNTSVTYGELFELLGCPILIYSSNSNIQFQFIEQILRRLLIASESSSSPDFELEFSAHPVLCLQDGFEHLQELSCFARFNFLERLSLKFIWLISLPLKDFLLFD